MARRVVRLLPGSVLAGALLLALAGPARAGDGGTVTVDTLPATASAGEPVRIGFVVFTHGRPIDTFGDRPVRPALTATHRATGEALRVAARKDGPPGHFAVEVTFPRPGDWDLRIKAEPLMVGTWTGTLTVAPAPTDPAMPDTAVVSSRAVAPAGGGLPAGQRRFPAGVFAVAATSLMLIGRRRLRGVLRHGQ